MAVAMRSKALGHRALQLRQPAAENPAVYREWWESRRGNMKFVGSELRERLMKRRAKVGPLSQHHALVAIDRLDVRCCIGNPRPPLVLIGGLDEPGMPPGTSRRFTRRRQGWAT